MPESDEKRNLVALICNHMRKDYITWNKDTVEDRKIAEDLNELSDGKLQLTDDILRLMAERIEQNYRPNKAQMQNNQRPQQNQRMQNKSKAQYGNNQRTQNNNRSNKRK